MLIIRFQRVGKKNQPSFRIVLAEKHRAASKKVLELLGHYNPRTKEFGVRKPERLDYWIKQHVEISATVRNLLITKGLLQGEKVKAWKPKEKKEKPKITEPVKAEAAKEAEQEALVSKPDEGEASAPSIGEAKTKETTEASASV